VPTQRKVSVPSGTLVVHVWPPPGPPETVVMLAHGYAEHALRYSHVAERLNELDALVVAPDQRGHGLHCAWPPPWPGRSRTDIRTSAQRSPTRLPTRAPCM
jgi:alpha-beta hydrolase superfamily lysophospholipase